MQLCAWGSRMPSWPVSNISILVTWWLVGDFQVQNCRALAGDPRSKLSFYFVVEIMQVGWLLTISLEDEWVGCQGAVRQMELFKIFAFEAWIAWSWLFLTWSWTHLSHVVRLRCQLLYQIYPYRILRATRTVGLHPEMVRASSRGSLRVRCCQSKQYFPLCMCLCLSLRKGLGGWSNVLVQALRSLKAPMQNLRMRNMRRK